MALGAIYDHAPGSGCETLLIMLPGTGSRPQDLIAHGFVRELRDRGLPVDVAVVDAHLGLYLDRTLSARLAQDVIAPACGKQARRVWLLGISLGGMGALLHAHEHAWKIQGVILLAPFLGARGTIAEIARAGGMDDWHPGEISPEDDERILLAWLRTHTAKNAAKPPIHLGYGTRDRYAAASAMLAARLPCTQVVTIDGGHDWATWLALWRRMLDQGLPAAMGTQPPAARTHAT